MKKYLALILSAIMCTSLVTGCSQKPAESSAAAPASSSAASSAVSSAAPAAPEAKSVDITVVTSYGGDDGNRGNYEAAIREFESTTGNKVIDNSGTSNEQWKSKILTDFQTGAEPDVLFYFNGVDANAIIQGNKVVSIDEIRAAYPEYASNMKETALGASPVDGKNYSVPVNGYWEGLYVNKKVLADCGVTVPGADYTWDQFLKDCETIKGKGYTPVAVSLQEVPHYWFEFTTLNNGSPANHIELPANSTDAIGKIWAAGLTDIKDLYDRGYLPANTLTATDPETCQMMIDDEAAFLIDGSWKMGYFKDNAEDLNNYTVTYVPAKGERKATDVVGGLSMGYYITRKAWDDPARRETCVKFVQHMTSDAMVARFSTTEVTALKNGLPAPSETNPLIDAAMVMTKGATSVSAAVQDRLNKTARNYLFASVKDIVTGKATPEAAIDTCLTTEDVPEA